MEHLAEKDFWKINQNGFREGRRTPDNVMIIKSLFEKYIKIKKQNVFMAFVDFRNFFDTIDRKNFLYKMIKSGITGNVYNVIKCAYDNNRYSVKCRSGLTKSFVSTSGVKQGCNLSPTLSNVFQNDLHDCFDITCDPVLLEGVEINSLSWADDLVFFSKTKHGSQKCLDNLAIYCDTLQLEVNVDKTKVIVLSSRRSRIEGITFWDEDLQCVDTYKYLGLIISSEGSIGKMEEDRVTKAKRASFAI